MSSISIRDAKPGDETRLALLGKATFLESYAHLLPADDILAHTEHNHAPGVYGQWLADPRYHLWLVEAGEGNAPVGYLVLSPPDLPVKDLTPKDVEIRRIYILHPFQGKGIGRLMMERATGHARSAGFTRMLLGVYSRNADALAFYAKIGFQPAGERYFRVGANEYFDHILGYNL